MKYPWDDGIMIYGRKKCKYCSLVTSLLDENYMDYQYIDIGDEPYGNEFRRMGYIPRHYRLLPFVFIDGKFIGGYDSMYAYVTGGNLPLFSKPKKKALDE